MITRFITSTDVSSMIGPSKVSIAMSMTEPTQTDCVPPTVTPVVSNKLTDEKSNFYTHSSDSVWIIMFALGLVGVSVGIGVYIGIWWKDRYHGYQMAGVYDTDAVKEDVEMNGRRAFRHKVDKNGLRNSS